MGDINASPECKRVVFAALLKVGVPLAVGGKYSEAIFARIIGESGRRLGGEGGGCTEDDEKGSTGLNIPKSKMNQVFEHGVVIFCTPQLH